VGRVGEIAGELQGDVGFDRGVDLGRAALIDGPAAIVELVPADVGGQAGDAGRLSLAENVQVEDVVGFEGGVSFEFADPVAFRGLEREQIARGALDGFVESLIETRGGRPRGHRAGRIEFNFGSQCHSELSGNALTYTLLVSS